MALFKEIVTLQGYTTTYHKIDYTVLSQNKLECTLSSFVTKTYRELEQPAAILSFEFNVTLEEEESMGIRQLAYQKIKRLPEWADATDC